MDLRILFTSAHSGLPILRCGNCGLVFVGYQFEDTEQQAFYNDMEGYAKFAESERSVPQVGMRHKAWVEQIKAQFEQLGHAPSDASLRLLDVGCGAGDFLAVAQQNGFQIRGQELSPAAAALASQWHNIQVEVKPLSELESNATDCLTMIGLLEHVTSPKEIIKDAYRLIAPGGLLFIYTPAWGTFDNLTTSLAQVTHNRRTRLIDRRINQAHLQIFPKATLIKFLEENGFRTVSNQVVCEYNLPAQRYFESVGLAQPRLQAIAVDPMNFLVDHNLFFRNNIRLLAQKV